MDKNLYICTDVDENKMKMNDIQSGNTFKIDIEMEDGKIEKIIFNEKEDPDLIAEKFCSMNQIDAKMKVIYKQLIVLKIKNCMMSLSERETKEINIDDNIMDEEKIPMIISTLRTERFNKSNFVFHRNENQYGDENEKINKWNVLDNWESPSFTTHKRMGSNIQERKEKKDTNKTTLSNLSCVGSTNTIVTIKRI